MKTKENNYQSVLRYNIMIFLSYLILFTFIFTCVAIFIKKIFDSVSSLPLTIALSLISAILIFHLTHFICRSSSIESLKKEKLDEENSKKFIKRMNLFFVICAIFSVLMCLGYLKMDRFIFSKAIAQAHSRYDIVSPDFANMLESYIIIEYEKSLLPRLFSTIITELALVVSFLSLVPYQEKLLKKFNK